MIGTGFASGNPTAEGGIPALDFIGTFKNQRCFGIMATGGEVTVYGSSFENSFGGIWALGNTTLSFDPYQSTFGPTDDLNMCRQPPLTGGTYCATRSVNGLFLPPQNALVGIDDPQVAFDPRGTAWRHWDPAAGA